MLHFWSLWCFYFVWIGPKMKNPFWNSLFYNFFEQPSKFDIRSNSYQLPKIKMQGVPPRWPKISIFAALYALLQEVLHLKTTSFFRKKAGHARKWKTRLKIDFLQKFVKNPKNKRWVWLWAQKMNILRHFGIENSICGADVEISARFEISRAPGQKNRFQKWLCFHEF